MIQRAFRYRLYPTAQQAERLTQFVGATRFVYNLALEQRETFGRRGRVFNHINQGREVTQLRKDLDWLREAPATALLQALRDLDRSFAAFFAGRARYPTPRRKWANDSFRIKAADSSYRTLNGKWGAVRIPNLGEVRFRSTRPLVGRWINVTVSYKAGAWYASFLCEMESNPAPSNLPGVGIDRGVANTIALSNGEICSTPKIEHLERRKMRAQRILSRRNRGSSRYEKQRRRLSRITAKIARVREDWRHRSTTNIARRFGHVVLEDLNTAAMTRRGRGKRGLNRSILAQGWRAFETTLAYKLEERGGTLVKVNPAYTSQQCSACGTIDKASRESQASFACRHCGFAGHADTNAAINILRRSTAVVEGSGCAPVEARTSHALAA